MNQTLDFQPRKRGGGRKPTLTQHPASFRLALPAKGEKMTSTTTVFPQRAKPCPFLEGRTE